jgi:hypothetical protein
MYARVFDFNHIYIETSSIQIYRGRECGVGVVAGKTNASGAGAGL